MKFSVGYQFLDEYENDFAESVCGLAEHIDEVYFPWLDTETCRASLINDRGNINWQGQAVLENALRLFREHGIKLNLLFNSNCYGEKSMSVYFKNYICSVIDHIQTEAGGLEGVTTTSPFVAQMVKTYFPEVKTRASVNMRIGTIKGMQYVADIFDGYYIQRDFNRDLDYIREVKAWTDSQGKTLHLLANSGCMSFCSVQTFHDNMVSHEKESREIRNVEACSAAACWAFYKKKENWPALLQNTWIRPEDLHHYDDLFPTVKLATRLNPRPLMVIKAYIERSFYGNTLDLLEPNHTSLLQGHFIDNKAFPADWFERSSSCGRQCHKCNYCAEVLQQVLQKVPDIKYI